MATDITLEGLFSEAAEVLEGFFADDAMKTCSGRLEELLDLAENHQLRQRTKLLNRLEKWILEAQACAMGNCLNAVSDLSLQAFGSSVMGISSRGGDLDISLEGGVRDPRISRSGHLTDADRRFRGDLLSEVHVTLQRGGHFRAGKSTQLVRTAKVPVSKFVEMETGIHCDLSIGNSIGVFKSQILGEVLQIDQRVRDLVVIVKKWAKANDLNDPSTGTFNSYCLTLLVVTFAQTRKPPLLPPFKVLFPDLRNTINQNGTSTGGPSLLSQVEHFKEIARTYGVGCNSVKNEETLLELLLEFLVCFSLLATHSQLMHYTAETKQNSGMRPTASPWDGGFVSNRWDSRSIKKYHFFVEDPFEAHDNCARTLATQDWWFVCKLLQKTVEDIQDFMNSAPEDKSRLWSSLSFSLFGKKLTVPFPGVSKTLIDEGNRLLLAHGKALFEHLQRFKASERKFIAFCNSWCSAGFKKILTSAVQELNLYICKGPKRKLIISKEGNLKEDMVEHAVNSTLKVRKQKTPIDPMHCVVKQRLREFLKCSLRVHVFRTANFRTEVKHWIAGAIESLALHVVWLDNGNLQIEVPTSLDRQAVQAHLSEKLSGIVRLDTPADGVSKIMEDSAQDGLPAMSMRGLEGEPLVEHALEVAPWDAELVAYVEPELDEEESDIEHNSGAESDGHGGDGVDEAVLGQDLAALKDQENMHVPAECGASVSTTDGHQSEQRQCCIVQLVANQDKSNTMSVSERQRQSAIQRVATSQFDNTSEYQQHSSSYTNVDLGALVSDCGQSDERVKVELQYGNCSVSVKVLVFSGNMRGQLSAEFHNRQEVFASSDKASCCAREEQNAGSYSTTPEATRDNLNAAESTVCPGMPSVSSTSCKQVQSCRFSCSSDAGSGWHSLSEENQLNADILRGVFYDLFDELSMFRQSGDPVAVIDPTDYVVPVGWVRQQVRDIARSLGLVVEKPLTAKRQMKVRVLRRGAGDDSDSDDDLEVDRQRDIHYHERPNITDPNLRPQVMSRPRKSVELQGNPACNAHQQRHTRTDDSLLKCFNWVKKLSKSNGKAFWAKGYSPEVQQWIIERAQENGLCAQVRDQNIWIGMGPENGQAKSVQRTGQRGSPWTVDSLNKHIMAGIQEHIYEQLQTMRMQGIEKMNIMSRGYIMKPEWVAEQAVQIGNNIGAIRVMDDSNGMLQILNLDAAHRRSMECAHQNMSMTTGFTTNQAQQLQQLLRTFSGTASPHASVGSLVTNDAGILQIGNSHLCQSQHTGPVSLTASCPEPSNMIMPDDPESSGRVLAYPGQSARPFPRQNARSTSRQKQQPVRVAPQGQNPIVVAAGASQTVDQRGSGGPHRHRRGSEEYVAQEGRGFRGRRGSGRGRRSDDTNSGKARGHRK